MSLSAATWELDRPTLAPRTTGDATAQLSERLPAMAQPAGEPHSSSGTALRASRPTQRRFAPWPPIRKKLRRSAAVSGAAGTRPFLRAGVHLSLAALCHRRCRGCARRRARHHDRSSPDASRRYGQRTSGEVFGSANRRPARDRSPRAAERRRRDRLSDQAGAAGSRTRAGHCSRAAAALSPRRRAVEPAAMPAPALPTPLPQIDKIAAAEDHVPAASVPNAVAAQPAAAAAAAPTPPRPASPACRCAGNPRFRTRFFRNVRACRRCRRDRTGRTLIAAKPSRPTAANIRDRRRAIAAAGNQRSRARFSRDFRGDAGCRRDRTRRTGDCRQAIGSRRGQTIRHHRRAVAAARVQGCGEREGRGGTGRGSDRAGEETRSSQTQARDSEAADPPAPMLTPPADYVAVRQRARACRRSSPRSRGKRTRAMRWRSIAWG